MTSNLTSGEGKAWLTSDLGLFVWLSGWRLAVGLDYRILTARVPARCGVTLESGGPFFRRRVLAWWGSIDPSSGLVPARQFSWLSCAPVPLSRLGLWLASAPLLPFLATFSSLRVLLASACLLLVAASPAWLHTHTAFASPFGPLALSTLLDSHFASSQQAFSRLVIASAAQWLPSVRPLSVGSPIFQLGHTPSPLTLAGSAHRAQFSVLWLPVFRQSLVCFR